MKESWLYFWVIVACVVVALTALSVCALNVDSVTTCARACGGRMAAFGPTKEFSRATCTCAEARP